MDPPQFIRPNHSTSRPGRWIFVDTETLPNPLYQQEKWRHLTHPQLHTLRLGCASYVRLEGNEVRSKETLDFTTREEFWDWAHTKTLDNWPIQVCAHNMGFDATVLGLWEMIESKEFRFRPKKTYRDDKVLLDLGCFIVDDPPTLIELSDERNRRWRFVDSLNYWRMSLDAIGKQLGIAKLKMPPNEASDKDWFTYCRRDVEVLEKAIIGLIRWVSEQKLGKFSWTTPSQAKSAFRHRFMVHKIVTHQRPKVRALERRGYYGGQVQIFRHGKVKGNLYQLDITSLYPSVMLGKLYPRELRSYEVVPDDKPTKPINLGICGVADVEVDTTERCYPYRTKDKVIYLQGNFRTTLVGPELKHAFDSGHITKMWSYALYDVAPIFDEYVNYFWSLRKEYKTEGNIVYDTLAKLLLNSLYGKFGQLDPSWEWVPGLIAPEPWSKWTQLLPETGEAHEYRSIGFRVQRSIEREEHKTAFPAIAAYVTSYGRERMRQLRSTAGDENVYYQAVDAVYTNQEGFDRLKDAGEVGDSTLGLLTLEGSAKEAEFRNLNNYTLGNKVIRGSIRRCRECEGKGKVDGKTCTVCQGDGVPRPNSKGQYNVVGFQHLASIITEPLLGGVLIGRTIKTLKDTYNRGKVGDDGWVEPFTLPQDIGLV